MVTAHHTTSGRSRVGTLVAINAVLAAIGLAGLIAPWANAQGGFASRARGNYMMVSGPANGVSGSLIYIADTANQELIALRYQRSSGRVEPIGYRSLTADSTLGGRSR